MKIFLIGWFGAGNVGDEAILLSEILSLREEFSGARFYVLSFCAERTRKLTAGIPEIEKIVGMGSRFGFLRSDFSGLLSAFRTTDLVVIGGGGIFQDIYNHFPIPFFTVMALTAGLFRKKFVLHAVGIGPVRTILGKNLCRITANRAHAVSVRDRESKELLEGLGVKRRIHVSADPVFLLPPGRNMNGDPANILSSKGRKTSGPSIGVCVHNLLTWNDTDKKIFAAVLDHLAQERKAAVIFLPMGNYRNGWFRGDVSEPVDVSASGELAGLMKSDSTVLDEEAGPLEMMSVAGSLDLIISMRFHGLVMGISRCVPVIALTFREESKLVNLMKRTGMEKEIFYANELNAKVMLGRIDNILTKHDEMKNELKEHAAVLTREAKEGIELLSRAI